jgi:long-chain acyl-CoA synthetase
VAIFLYNCPQFIIAYFGVLKAGAVVTAVNPMYREREVECQLCDAEAHTIIVLDAFYSVVEKIRDKTQLKNIIIVTDADFYSTPATGSKADGLYFRELIKKDCYEQAGLHSNPEEKMAVIQYTGGTTGSPKGAMLTHTNLVSNALSFASWIKGTSNDVFLAVLPFCHVYGMTTSMTVPISLGAEIVLQSKFDPAKSLQVIAQYRVTVFCGSPTMYAMLLANKELEKGDLSSVRLCISGASPLPMQIQKQFIQTTGCCLVEGYG